jgi:hypothetical protein
VVWWSGGGGGGGGKAAKEFSWCVRVCARVYVCVCARVHCGWVDGPMVDGCMHAYTCMDGSARARVCVHVVCMHLVVRACEW